MSVYDFPGYLAQPRPSLGAELIGFNAKTGQPVQAAAGFGSYEDLKRDAYLTYQHENWQHPGSSEWTKAPVPGWGNNPLLAGPPRRALYGLGQPTTVPWFTYVSYGVLLLMLGGAFLGFREMLKDT